MTIQDLPQLLRENLHRQMDEGEWKYYKANVRKMLLDTEDKEICRQQKMFVEYKLYALGLKYGRDIAKELEYRKGNLYFRGVRIYSLKAKSLFSVDILEIAEGKLHIAGRIWCPFPEDIHFYFEDDKKNQYEVVSKPASFKKAVIWGEEIMRVRGYDCYLPLSGVKWYRAYGRYRENSAQRLYVKFGKFSCLNHEIGEQYLAGSDYMVSYRDEESQFLVEPNRVFQHMKKELRLLVRCLRDGKAGLAGYRILTRLLRPFCKKERWIVMDRIHTADDNAEHLFRFLCKEKKSKIKSWFVLMRRSPDFKRMKKVGKVLAFREWKYKLNVLLATCIVSSQAEDNLFNPWDVDGIYMRDLYRYKYIFLQHGIIKHDLSAWLNRFNKNLSLFVTSAVPEYQAILKEDYFYDESVVKLTGLPRYDALKQELRPKKQIFFLPTWRTELAGAPDPVTGVRQYNPDFKSSAFFRFYQALIQDERLLETMRRCGYKGKFCLHPHHMVQLSDFMDNDTIQVARDKIQYQREFQENALMITDYSSVAFDFAYLKKPVIYTQFDRDTFFDGQLYSQGSFDYERDELGPVCLDYESAVQTLIHYIENDCRVEPKYKERQEAFFRWSDDQNCQRVYEEIRSLS